MTIRPPINNPLPAAAPAPGLPDVAELARLANAFFASLPGSVPARPEASPVQTLAPAGLAAGPDAAAPEAHAAPVSPSRRPAAWRRPPGSAGHAVLLSR
ncbi:hypothetical protein ACE0DR_06950 [Azotobacter sp. CWF10]